MILDRVLILLPHSKPVGGVLKMLDYAQHAVTLGCRTEVHFIDQSPDGIALSFPQFDALRRSPLFSYKTGGTFLPKKTDLVVFSLPTNFEVIKPHFGATISLKQVLHVIQGTRHPNQEWLNGYPRRLLRVTISRLCINDVVRDVISQYVPPTSVIEVNELAHDTAFFAADSQNNRLLHSSSDGSPIRVGYTTWKSALGNLLRREESLAEFEFKSIEGFVDWHELREFYSTCDIFLAFPNEEEGMYLPGLEAMSAGCFLVTPMVKGNTRYAIPGINCVESKFGDVSSYISAIKDLVDLSPTDAFQLFENAVEMSRRFDLETERRGFGEFLQTHFPHLDQAN